LLLCEGLEGRVAGTTPSRAGLAGTFTVKHGIRGLRSTFSRGTYQRNDAGVGGGEVRTGVGTGARPRGRVSRADTQGPLKAIGGRDAVLLR